MNIYIYINFRPFSSAENMHSYPSPVFAFACKPFTTPLHPGFRAVTTQALGQAYPCGGSSSLQLQCTHDSAPSPHGHSAGPTPVAFLQFTTPLHTGFRSVATQALGRAFPRGISSVYNSNAPMIPLRRQALGRAYPCGISSVYNSAAPRGPRRRHMGTRPGLPLWWFFKFTTPMHP